MLIFWRPKLPISTEACAWVDSSFVRLEKLLGRTRLLTAQVMLPTPECFPDPFDGSETSLDLMYRRIATQMGINPESVELSTFTDPESTAHEFAPLRNGVTSGASGLYFGSSGKSAIAIHENKLKDPLGLVATIAHELGHVLLLRPDLVDRDEPDMEPLTDLLTVFLGFGVFNANAAFRFQQYANNEIQGWSTTRSGYLSEQMFAYALARFARERGEDKPPWAAYLRHNVKSYFKRSASWLEAQENSNGR